MVKRYFLRIESVIFVFCLITIVSCQSIKQGDWFSLSNRQKQKKQRDSYTTASGKTSRMDFHDTYSNAGGRRTSKEGRDSYSSATSKKWSFKFWKFWKRDPRNKTSKSYNVSRKRKVFLKRKPPQGIKAS